MNEKHKRIVLVGDFQTDSTPESMIVAAMEDVRSLSPDLVIVMGDMGHRDNIGTPEGIEYCSNYLSLINAPSRPLLGNHDLQNEIGCNVLQHGTMEKTARERFGIDDTYFVYELDQVRIFGISLDTWTVEPPFSRNECYVSAQRFNWIRKKISERPGVPIIMITHAPPMGAGLRTVPDVHVRATNAYMDQNSEPLRWINLTKHPEIILWLSAHYHLSHNYSDSLVTRNGVTYALIGVHSNATRDGERQSRVLDLIDDTVMLSTLDHTSRILKSKSDWAGSVTDFMKARMSMKKPVDFPKTENWIDSLGPLGKGGIKVLPNKHILVSTAENYLWQVDPQWEVYLGTIHYHEGPLTDYCISDGFIWRIFGSTLVSVHYLDPWRFSREKSNDYRHEYRIALSQIPYKLQPIPGGVKVWYHETSEDFENPNSLIDMTS